MGVPPKLEAQFTLQNEIPNRNKHLRQGESFIIGP